MPKILDLKGKRFGRLLVMERVFVQGARNVMWKCKCDCGNKTIAAAANIGRTTFSCGCFAKEVTAALLRGNRYRRTHNMSHTPEHRAWATMKGRCYNPNNHKYPLYGGRGIRVCKRWLDSFDNFYADMGPRPSKKHSIDRINNDGNYKPDNCHWTTNFYQVRNRRTTNLVEIDGITLCIKDWCKRLGVHRSRPYDMLRAKNSRFTSTKAAIIELYRRHVNNSQRPGLWA